MDPCFDGTAEWNAFWDPEAVKCGPSLEIHMQGLESTEGAPLTRDLPAPGPSCAVTRPST
ncbi:MAG: hypothetical protein ACLVKA_11465 [Collinsella aerofaciens]